MNFWQTLPRPFLALAPMEGVTDTVFRRMIISLGRPEMVYTEFTNVQGMCSEGSEKVEERLVFTPEEKPIVAQIWGTKPELFLAAARRIAGLGFDGIDINFGCPDRAVVKIGAGAAMISDDKNIRKQVIEIIQATKEGAGDLPVSVKTRIGHKEIITEEWIGFLLEQRIAAIAVHLRTGKEKSEGKAHWDEMEKIIRLRNEYQAKTGNRTVIIGNGDVTSRQEAENKRREYGMDGVMIGRGVFANPAVFAKPGRELTKGERLAVLAIHAEMYDRQWRGKKPWAEMKKNIKMYVAGFSGAVGLRGTLMEADSAAGLKELMKSI